LQEQKIFFTDTPQGTDLRSIQLILPNTEFGFHHTACLPNNRQHSTVYPEQKKDADRCKSVLTGAAPAAQSTAVVNRWQIPNAARKVKQGKRPSRLPLVCKAGFNVKSQNVTQNHLPNATVTYI
jgi:hypothetical protein